MKILLYLLLFLSSTTYSFHEDDDNHEQKLSKMDLRYICSNLEEQDSGRDQGEETQEVASENIPVHPKGPRKTIDKPSRKQKLQGRGTINSFEFEEYDPYLGKCINKSVDWEIYRPNRLKEREWDHLLFTYKIKPSNPKK